jgi:1-acyl-sn-glycerol-3-phosphate acyltransferase
MFRFYYTIVMRIGSIIHFVPKMRKYAKHPEVYSEEECHELCKIMIAKVAKTARATTSYYGLENLPADGGYIMYANHQGKYDALGIMWGHPRPCRVLMNLKRSKMPIANEYISLVRGKRLDHRDFRQQVQCINEIAEEVKEGKIYLIFPEGGYRKNGQDNYMNQFRSGCIRSAIKSGQPIVPVALIDSYKPFGIKGLKPVHTQVHFLPPIPHGEFCDLGAAAVAQLLQERIAAHMESVLGYPVWHRENAAGEADTAAEPTA